FAAHGIALSQMVKTIAATTADGEIIVIGVRGDREVRLPHGWDLLSDEQLEAHPGLHKGSIGLIGLSAHGIKVAVDAELVATPGPWLSGGNAASTHTSNVFVGRDVTPDLVGSFVVVEPGDPCPNCGKPLDLIRSVEAAHTFQLGIQYSQKMSGASFLGEDGTEQLFWMGCYGIGVSRLLGVLAEAHHDEQGLVWPATLAPYDLHLVSLGANRNPEIASAAASLYEKLSADGFAVLYDDRDASPGVKFADADLLGIPTRLLLGGKGLERGIVEWKRRTGGEEGELALDGPFDLLR
ncbi:MAG: His/Gly/Thr/Pro-type tRNA ligase C-terminal domain-containing protein, partial [Actinomycetota bacterium]